MDNKSKKHVKEKWKTTLGRTAACDLTLAVSKECEAAAATVAEKPAARLDASGLTGPASSRDLIKGKRKK